MFTAGAPSVPDALIDQLADGGRLVAPIGAPDHQALTRFTRRGRRIERRTLESCVFVPLPGRYGWPRQEIVQIVAVLDSFMGCVYCLNA